MKFQLFLILIFFSWNCQLPAQQPPQGIDGDQRIAGLMRGPYLQSLTSGSVVIRWRTDGPTDSKVMAGTSLAYDITVTDSTPVTEHIVTLNNLKPYTRYYYSIGNSSLVLQGNADNYFYTAPAKGSFVPVRIWATGDFGIGSTAQAQVRDAYLNASQKPTNLWIWLGDNAYASGTDQEYQSYVFDMYPQPLKQFPLMPAPGNHDYGNTGFASQASLTTDAPYFSIFTVPFNGEAGGTPSGTPKYYSYNYSNIHFISLDSYGSYQTAGSPMYEWLKKDLAHNTQRWTIVYFHHPPYTKGTHDSDVEVELVSMRENIIPLLESYGVDLVLSGHSHVNERSYLMKGHFGLAGTFNEEMKVQKEHSDFIKNPPYKGTVYAVCGTSGQSAGPPKPDAPMPCMYFNDFTSNCSMVIEVDRDVLNASYLSLDGTIKNQFSITKTGPTSLVNNGEVSCDISYQSNESAIYLSCFATSPTSLKAELYNVGGEKISGFKELPDSIPAGYSLNQVRLPRNNTASGMYIFTVQIGDQLFSRKLMPGK